MQKLIKYRHLVLRLGLAFVLIYAGISIIRNPGDWIGFVPEWMEKIVSRELFLTIHAYFEVMLGLAAIFNFWPRVLYLVTALDMLSILVFYGIDAVSFRDVGLLALAFGLWLDSMNESRVSS